MKSRTVPDFWKSYRDLPPEIQRRVSKAYRLWRANPFAGSLRFKRVSETEPIYSVRIGQKYRALGLLEGDIIYGYFIGTHDKYERQLKMP
jgi:mRNA-degrading endonuclease RelE of RelBE toxin-antitoxin system